MKRALVIGALLAGCALWACDADCKNGSIFLRLTTPAGTSGLTMLDVDVSVDGGKQTTTTVAAPSAGAGSIVVEFPHGYPAGQKVTIAVTLRGADGVHGMRSVVVDAEGACASATLDFPTLTVPGDLGATDAVAPSDVASPVDLARPTITGEVDGEGTIEIKGVTCAAPPCIVGTDYDVPATVLAVPLATSLFAGWTSGCRDTARSCVLDMKHSYTAHAHFVARTNNLAFVTSSIYPANLGGAASYDAKCNERAVAAGYQSAGDAHFVAFVSDATSSAITRIGSAHGYTRTDGLPFIDMLDTQVHIDAVIYPLALNENGVHVGPPSSNFNSAAAWSGISDYGVAADAANSCQNWTSILSTDYGRFGAPDSGPRQWYGGTSGTCDMQLPLFCFETTHSAALPAITAPAGAKRAWVSTPWTPSGGPPAADAKCKTDGPLGVAAAKAMLARFTPQQSVVANLDAGTTYVRIDGAVIGTGAEIAANQLGTGIWQAGSGAYIDTWVWTGIGSATAPTMPADSASFDCQDWTIGDGTREGGIGGSGSSDQFWFADGNQYCNTPNVALFCVEQ